MKKQHFIRYDMSFINALQLQNIGVADLDTLCQTELKSFLLNKNSFLLVGIDSMSDVDIVRQDIQNLYNNIFIKKIQVQYNEVEKAIQPLQRKYTEMSSFKQGDIDTENTAFEPVVDNSQKEIKMSGQHVVSGDNNTTIDRLEEYTSESQLQTIKSFYDSIANQIANAFMQYVNTYDFLDNDCCCKWYQMHCRGGNINVD